MDKLKIGMLLFPNLTVLDFTGPYEVFVRASCFEVYVVSENKKLVAAEGGLSLKPDFTFDDCPDVDILFVPGGKGITPLLTNKLYIDFLQKKAIKAKYITAVCTGSLLLAASKLLDGYKATTHWRSLELLQMFDVETIEQRVVVDRNRITGGGITAGLDFGLSLTALIGGDRMAKAIQLMLEYNPEPPFTSGNPKTAESDIFKIASEMTQSLFDERKEIIRQIARLANN
ncbi:MAG TPA: DJ-1/PfpI family protein [Cyclobacteriaceae bacterium]